VPASKALATAERALGDPGRGGANRRLASGLDALRLGSRYGAVLIDCPPGMTALTSNDARLPERAHPTGAGRFRTPRVSRWRNAG
jgi:hypothetical protein